MGRKELGWQGILNNVKAMANSALTDFTGAQVDRLRMLLGGECEDPIYLTCYYVGYSAGYIGEQVAVAFFTAGIAKAGVISKVLRAGGGAVGTLMTKAAAKFPQTVALAGGAARSTGEHIQKLSKGFFGQFGRASRCADEVRSARRSASLCRTTAGCRAAGTLVAMADGTWRPVEHMHMGDKVLSLGTDGRRTVQTVQTVQTQICNTAPLLHWISWDENGDGIPEGAVSATGERKKEPRSISCSISWA